MKTIPLTGASSPTILLSIAATTLTLSRIEVGFKNCATISFFKEESAKSENKLKKNEMIKVRAELWQKNSALVLRNKFSKLSP
jgi:hypothetical protein